MVSGESLLPKRAGSLSKLVEMQSDVAV